MYSPKYRKCIRLPLKEAIRLYSWRANVLISLMNGKNIPKFGMPQKLQLIKKTMGTSIFWRGFSAPEKGTTVHTGSLRIAKVTMSTLSFSESHLSNRAVSLASLFANPEQSIAPSPFFGRYHRRRNGLPAWGWSLCHPRRMPNGLNFLKSWWPSTGSRVSKDHQGLQRIGLEEALSKDRNALWPFWSTPGLGVSSWCDQGRR
jgi:hypothetical protein